MAIQVIQRNRPRLSEAFGNLAATLQQNEEFGTKTRMMSDQNDEQKAQERAKAIVQVAVGRNATPEQWSSLRSSLQGSDPRAAAYIPDISGLPLSEFEQAKQRLDTLNTQNRVTSAGRIKNDTARATDATIAFNPGEVGKEPFRQQQLSDVLMGGTGASADQVKAARVENKIEPTADVALRERTEGPLRTAQAQLASADATFTAGPKTKDTLASAVEHGASAREKNAQARKYGAETAAIGAAGTVTGSNLAGDDYLKSLPQSEARLVKSIADYLVDPSKVASLRNPKDADSERNRLIKEVLQYDPSYDMTQFPSRSKLRTDFNSGAGAKNIRSINTAVEHLNTLASAANELHNVGGLPLVNTGVNYLKNKAGQLSGASAKTKFDNAATAVDNELASVFKGTGATDQEISQWRGALNSNMSPEQMAAAIRTRIELMGGRLSALSSQYEQGMGKPHDFKILNDSSRKILQKFGVDPDALESGQVVGISGAQQPQNHQPVQSSTPETRTTPDGKTWRKVQGGWELVH